MTAAFLCAVLFLATLLAARKSLRRGLVVVVAVGYFYGIARANLQESAAHFLFDASVIGLYCAQLLRPISPEATPSFKRLKPWLLALMIWPAILCFLPIQDPLGQLVGLRGNVFLLAFVVFGIRLEEDDRDYLATAFAILNIVALGFALAEYSKGVEPFYPRSAVTDIIYRSKDLVGYTAYRIPATFTGSHAYAGTLVMTIPILDDSWMRGEKNPRCSYLLFA